MRLTRCLRSVSGPARRAAGVIVALCLLSAPVFAQAVRNVLIVSGEARTLPGNRILLDAIQGTIRRESTTPVDFYIETIDTARFDGETYDRRLADLVAAKYGQIRLDLVIAYTEPAVDFVLRHRAVLSPETPLLLGFIEGGLVDRALPPGAGIVFVDIDPAGTLRLALQTYPAAQKVLVVGGTSRFDRMWLKVVKEKLQRVTEPVSITYDTESPVEELVHKARVLRPDTIVLFVSMSRDGANLPAAPVDVLQRLRAAAPVPIYGMSTTFLGNGIVGGSLLDFDRHGAELGHAGVRMLAGEHPAPTTTPATAAVDWRELQRFQMSTAGLPPSTRILYREQSLWEREKRTILVSGFVITAETALILTLVWVVRRRRETQGLLEGRLRFEMLLSDLTRSLTNVSGSFEETLEVTLGRVAKGLGLDGVWRWSFDEGGWDSPQLRTGQPMLFPDPAQLPPSVRDKLHAAGCLDCTSMATPLPVTGVVSGALFWYSHDAGIAWLERVGELRMIANAVANVLQRKYAESALEQSDQLKGAILSSLPAQVAVLDRAGTIISVNDAWMEFGRENGADVTRIGTGTNYLAACRGGARAGFSEAGAAVHVIEAACRGERTDQQIEYSCDSTDRQRWFLMRAEPLRRSEGGAVVTHSDITRRKLNEIALRESEGRFRRLADALPVAIWMSEADGTCSYFNQQWLEMTGRSFEEEVAAGRVAGIHPDDRRKWMEMSGQALCTREPFRLEYRIQRRDGEYRWLMDTAMPRYGSDGAFHGFLGGCVDITERKGAEQMLRDLNRRLIVAQEDERRRIARELHDHLNQQLALLAIGLQQLVISPPEPADALSATMQDLWRRTTEIASDVHSISHRLHPYKLEALGLVATIRAHCRDLAQQRLAVEFSAHDVPHDIHPDVAVALFRILEEALSNVARHSGASGAHVALTGDDPDTILLRVSDAGRGFSASRRRHSGLGLVSMRERLEALGGTFSITSTPGQGTVVEARVPRVQAAQENGEADVATWIAQS